MALTKTSPGFWAISSKPIHLGITIERRLHGEDSDVWQVPPDLRPRGLVGSVECVTIWPFPTELEDFERWALGGAATETTPDAWLADLARPRPRSWFENPDLVLEADRREARQVVLQSGAFDEGTAEFNAEVEKRLGWFLRQRAAHSTGRLARRVATVLANDLGALPVVVPRRGPPLKYEIPRPDYVARVHKELSAHLERIRGKSVGGGFYQKLVDAYVWDGGPKKKITPERLAWTIYCLSVDPALADQPKQLERMVHSLWQSRPGLVDPEPLSETVWRYY